MNNYEKIIQSIEVERKELNRLAARYGLQHKRVLQQSVLLDQLINKYNSLIYANLQRKKPIA
ncbi:aspartyl-phosphate phosphatase Spo0E family protein [Paenibacillus sp. M1]|uniref:Aspartyl-phosphate phosphatase Spo0E family protein n=1 Tax=Paenibacillus haidiansis TaxID=1574488 RepID=A0ABU7VRP0_9BACL